MHTDKNHFDLFDTKSYLSTQLFEGCFHVSFRSLEGHMKNFGDRS